MLWRFHSPFMMNRKNLIFLILHLHLMIYFLYNFSKLDFLHKFKALDQLVLARLQSKFRCCLDEDFSAISHSILDLTVLIILAEITAIFPIQYPWIQAVYTYSRLRVHAHIYIYIYIYTRAHTHKHTHTHIYIYIYKHRYMLLTNHSFKTRMHHKVTFKAE